MLHVYHVGQSYGVKTANGLLNVMGSGAYHAAIQVYDLEWSFGAISFGTGVFWCEPKQCNMHVYYKSISLGSIRLSREKVDTVLKELKEEWPGENYDLLRHNCCHFSAEFARRLG